MDGFPKAESYGELKEERAINSRTDLFKVLTGRFFKPLENQLYGGQYDDVNFIKHVPVPERPDKIMGLQRDGMYYYENDYKSFEAHFADYVMDSIECVLYRHAFSRYPGVAELICRVLQMENRIRTPQGLKLKIRARRMSGDMCTSLGNGFTNKMLIQYLAYKKRGSVRGFVEGDDGLFATTFKLTEADFKEIGWTVEIHEHEAPNEAHFCGMLFSKDSQLIKDPRRVMRSFFWSSTCLDAGEKVLNELRRSKALSLCYEMPQCPILGVLGREALSRTDGCKMRIDPADSWHATMLPRSYTGPDAPFNPTDETRRLFHDKFGVSVDSQLACEGAIRSWDLTRLGQLLVPETQDLWYSSRYLEVL